MKTITGLKYTVEMIKELQRCSIDPIYFISNYCYVQDPVDGKIKFKLHAYQEEIVQAFLDHRSVAWAGVRQEGRTSLLAAYMLWYANFKHDKYCALVLPNQQIKRSARDLVRFMYEHIPSFLKCQVTRDNKEELELLNGSKIFFGTLTPVMFRGSTFNLIAIDDLSLASVKDQHEAPASLMPCICYGGDCIISANPTGDHDLFWEIWNHNNSFFKIKTDTSKIPGRDADWKRYMKLMLDEEVFARELEVCI